VAFKFNLRRYNAPRLLPLRHVRQTTQLRDCPTAPVHWNSLSLGSGRPDSVDDADVAALSARNAGAYTRPLLSST